MRIIHRNLVFLLAGFLLCGLAALAQDDSSSLGDVARQSRLQKQQKDAPSASDQSVQAQAKAPAGQASSSAPPAGSPANTNAAKNATVPNAAPAKTEKHVITDDDIHDPVKPSTASTAGSKPAENSSPQQPADSSQHQQSADQWRSQIQALKNNIASLQQQIGELSDSIQYAGGNCVSGCVEWNQRQQEKQQQVESMKAQLELRQKALDDAQDSARRDGYGSSVYDP